MSSLRQSYKIFRSFCNFAILYFADFVNYSGISIPAATSLASSDPREASTIAKPNAVAQAGPCAVRMRP